VVNTELVRILALKKVLESASEGMGLAQSVARELRRVEPPESESARLVLLGYPLAVALRPLVESGCEEVSMLASLIVSAPRSSSEIIGRNGGILAGTLERWVKARESGKLQRNALRFRSLVTCGVLGAVTAMVASLGPLVGSLDFAGTSPTTGSATLLYSAAGLTGISSFMLGLFMSGRSFYLNVAVALGVFTLVSALASPLANVSTVSLWGVK
jgi:hypothetical protein